MAGNDDSDLYRMVLAAQEGRAGEVGALSRSLVAGKADINDDGIFGLSALCWAAWNNHAPVVSALLQAGAACEYRPLWVASLQGSTDAAVELLVGKADPNGDNVHGTSALWAAADRGHAHTVQALVGAKANVHQACVRGRTPLFVAAKRGHRDVVQFLLQHGVVVDEAGKYGEECAAGRLGAARLPTSRGSPGERSCRRRPRGWWDMQRIPSAQRPTRGCSHTCTHQRVAANK